MIVEQIKRRHSAITIISLIILVACVGRYIYTIQTEKQRKEENYANAIKAKEELIQILKNNNPDEGKLKYEEI